MHCTRHDYVYDPGPGYDARARSAIFNTTPPHWPADVPRASFSLSACPSRKFAFRYMYRQPGRSACARSGESGGRRAPPSRRYVLDASEGVLRTWRTVVPLPGTLLYRPMPPAAAPVANEAAGRWRRCSPRECSRARGRIRIGSTEPVRGLHARQTVPSCTGRGVHVCSTSRLPQPHGALPPLQEIRSVHRTHCSQSQP